MLSEIREFLGCATPDAWVEAALRDQEVLLIDHKNNEFKAASTRGVWLSESFAEQDGWLVHEERVRWRDWINRLPPHCRKNSRMAC